MAKDVDCIVLGGGHNGLVASWYLARAGLQVMVLERRETVGGAAVTAELFPGSRHTVFAYLCHMLQRQVIDDMDLRRHGFHVYPLDPAALFIYPDGSHFRMWHDYERTAEEIGRISAVDGAAYPGMMEFWERAGSIVQRYLLQRPPTITQIVEDLRGTPEAAVFEALLTVPVRDMAEQAFEHSGIAAAWLGTSDYGQIDAPGSALVQSYLKAGLLQPDEDFGIVRGGMGAITQAMARSVEEAGVTIRTGATVRRIMVADGSVQGVELTDGETLTADIVLSNADPKATFLSLVEAEALPAAFVRAVRRLKTRSGSAKLNCTLSRLPDFSRYLEPDDDETRLAMLRIMPSLDAVSASWDDAMHGIPTRFPLMQVQLPSVLDPTLAPAGQQVMSVWIIYEPVRPRAGSWASLREEVGEGIIDAVAAYAPDLRDCIEDWRLFTPDDISEWTGMTDGNIRHLDILPQQMLASRPLLGWSDYSTPIEGLYLCGSGTHPGGEVTGAPGHNAAQAVLAQD